MDVQLLIPIFGIVGVFGMPVFIVWIIHYYESRSEKQFHQALQELIKSGQELSPELLQSIPGYKKLNGKRNDIRTGTITIGAGFGIGIFGQFGVAETSLVAIGLMVLSTGFASLASTKF